VKYDPDKHHRRSIRLKEYDYAQAGAYFITICVQGRECVLGEVVNGEMRLTDWGRVVQYEWEQLPQRFPNVQCDAFVVMPNHAHGIVVITDDGRGTAGRAPTASRAPTTSRAPTAEQFGKPVPGSLPTIVRSFKSAVTKRINDTRDTPGAVFWQRNYWEHVIRNDADLARIREYIQNNPARWMDDQLHPDAPPNKFNRG
jgi:putative transposase